MLCEDTGVIGAPFLVTEWVEGEAAASVDAKWRAYGHDDRRRLANEMVGALAQVSLVDWSGIGLDGFGRPEGFLGRQVDRWLGQLSRYQSRTIPHLDSVAGWLRSHTPPDIAAGLLHGDYSGANVMFDHRNGGAIAAIIDWELATVGDPMLDLGWFLSTWEQAGDDTSGRVPGQWAMHCHLLLHMEMGMFRVVEVSEPTTGAKL